MCIYMENKFYSYIIIHDTHVIKMCLYMLIEEFYTNTTKGN